MDAKTSAKILVGKTYLHNFQISPHILFRKSKNNNVTVEKPGRSNTIQVYTINTGMNWHYVPPDVMF